MLRRDRAVLLALALLVLLPSAGEAGEGGYINLVNGTPYNWWLVEQPNSNMGHWDFPDVITAGSTAKVYVEFSYSTLRWNLWASATYSLGKTGPSFRIDATLPPWPASNNLSVDLTNLSMPGNPQGSIIDLGWGTNEFAVRNGVVHFILAGEAGSFTSNGLPNAWMHENLGVLGSRSLQHLCIPGSHDAGMSLHEYESNTLWARECNTVTQTRSVLEQLNSGVRYFDIRPVISDGEFVTGHYNCSSILLGCQGANGQSLDSIIDDVNTYTAANQELVVLYLSHDLNTEAWWIYPPFTNDEWCRLLSKLKRLNYRFVPNRTVVDLTELTLSEFIGSRAAVVVVGDPANSALRLDSLSGCGFVTADEGFYSPKNFPIFDAYSNTDNLDAMQQDQLSKLHVQRPNPDTRFFVLSWTLTLQGAVDNFDCGLNDILSLAYGARSPLYQNILPVSNFRTYPNVLYIDRVESGNNLAALAMAVNSKAAWDKPKGYVIYKGLDPDSNIYVAYPPDSNLANGGAWELTRMNPAINSSDTPGAVSFAGGLYVLYKGSGSDSRIYVAQSAGGNILDGESWSAQPLNPAINTSTGPGVAILDNTLYMLYKGAGGDSNVYIARSNGNVGDGNSWNANRLNPGINTSHAPAVAAFNGALYLFYKGAGGDANIYIARHTGDVFDGNLWTHARLNPGINTSDAPGIVAYKGALYMFYKGFGADANIYIARSPGQDIMNGTTWSYARLNPGINTTVAPKPVVVGGSLYLFYTGLEGNIWIAQPQGADVFNGNAWTWERLNSAINTSVGPGAAGM